MRSATPCPLPTNLRSNALLSNIDTRSRRAGRMTTSQSKFDAFKLTAVGCCLALTTFSSRKMLGRWRHDYHDHRPNSSLGGLTPAAVTYSEGLNTKIFETI